MTTLRRWAPLGVFVVLALAWTVINLWASRRAALNQIAQETVLVAYFRTKFPDFRPADPGVDVLARSYHLGIVWPGVLLLVGAALLAVVLRAVCRGPVFLLAALALVAGARTVGKSALESVMGFGVVWYTEPVSFKGIDNAPFAGGGEWLVWLALGLAVGASLIPAAMLRMGSTPATPRRMSPRLLFGRSAVAGISLLGVVTAGQHLFAAGNGTPTLLENVGITVGVVVAAYVLAVAHQARTVATLWLGLAATTVGASADSTLGSFGTAALLATLIVAAAGATLVPWRRTRVLLNRTFAKAVPLT